MWEITYLLLDFLLCSQRTQAAMTNWNLDQNRTSVLIVGCLTRMSETRVRSGSQPSWVFLTSLDEHDKRSLKTASSLLRSILLFEKLFVIVFCYIQSLTVIRVKDSLVKSLLHVCFPELFIRKWHLQGHISASCMLMFCWYGSDYFILTYLKIGVTEGSSQNKDMTGQDPVHCFQMLQVKVFCFASVWVQLMGWTSSSCDCRFLPGIMSSWIHFGTSNKQTGQRYLQHLLALRVHHWLDGFMFLWAYKKNNTRI